MNIMITNTENDIKIVPAVPTDIPEMLEIYAYYVKNTAISFEYDVPDEAEFMRRFVTVNEKYPFLAAKHDGKVVGYAYAHEFIAREAYRFSAESTIYIDREHHRLGIGKMLYNELERLLIPLGITNLYACIGVPSEDDGYLTHNSIDFHEHIGFKQVGVFHNCGYKFDRWYDMVWAEKIIGEYTTKR